MKLVKRKEVTKLMDESELYGNAEKERRKSDMVQNDELFFCFFSGTNMMMSKQKQKSKHAMEKKIFLLDSLTLLCDCTDLSQIHFHAL